MERNKNAWRLPSAICKMLNRLSLNNKNSSRPPSSDPNRKKYSTRDKTNKKPGGQPERIGKQLKPVSDPDKIKILKLDKRTLPRDNYTKTGFETRQVIFWIRITS